MGRLLSKEGEEMNVTLIIRRVRNIEKKLVYRGYYYDGEKRMGTVPSEVVLKFLMISAYSWARYNKWNISKVIKEFE